MGLDTTHGAWHGAYSAFHRWRQEIAKAAGFPPLELMEGFWPGLGRNPETMTVDDLPWTDSWAQNQMMRGMFVAGRLPMKWDELADHAGDKRLVPLLTHSDCEGSMSVDECRETADALEAILPRLKGDGGGHIGSYRDKTETFIRGLRAAVAANEPLEFH